MAEKRLRRMSRKELIEIIYVLQKNEQELTGKIADLEEQLRHRDVIMDNAGSIAEAVVGLNEIFSVAQKTADEYLASIRASVEFASTHPDADLSHAQFAVSPPSEENG